MKAVVATAAGCQPPVTTASRMAVERLVDAPRVQLGQSRAELTRALGPPRRVTSRDAKNRHADDVVDRVWTLEFDGAWAEVYEATLTGRDILRYWTE